jgi:hypothetical protein
MYLSAITIGYAVPTDDFKASVHSVFHSAMNLRLADGDGLLTLVLTTEPDLPQGIRLDSPEGFSFESFRVNEPAISRGGILHFDHSHLAVQLGNARRWESGLSKLEINRGNPVVSTAWSLVWEVLNLRQKRLHAEIIADDLLRSEKRLEAGIASKAGEAMRELVMCTQQLSLTDASAIKTLVGLGSGLTPSGDDLLAGYLAGLWCTVGKRDDRVQFISQLGKYVIELSSRTNDISRTYLFHAAHGQVSSRVAVLAEAIGLGEDSDHLLEVADQAMQNGSTSGLDTVTGLLVGISTWAKINR